MPTERNNSISPTLSGLDPDLVDDLEKVARLVREKTSSSGECTAALALVRVLAGVGPEEWERFASLNGLENWLGIPLDCSLADSVSEVLSVQERLAFQRDHDALTCIGNRGLFNRLFTSEFERAVRSHTDLSLLMLDLDNFKQVNDTYGHACGDQVLQRLGALLKAQVRQYDIPVRFGGEEFAVILPATSCWTAVVLGNRILDLFRQEEFACNGSTFSMTFSGGAASLALLEQDAKNTGELIKSADEALYEAKRQGKNHIALVECGKLARDRSSLVLSQEKQFLFSCLGSE